MRRQYKNVNRMLYTVCNYIRSNVTLSNSIKLRLYFVRIDRSVSHTLNLTSPDALDLRMPCAEAINLVPTNRLQS
jgi:hypothetical protein